MGLRITFAVLIFLGAFSLGALWSVWDTRESESSRAQIQDQRSQALPQSVVDQESDAPIELITNSKDEQAAEVPGDGLDNPDRRSIEWTPEKIHASRIYSKAIRQRAPADESVNRFFEMIMGGFEEMLFAEGVEEWHEGRLFERLVTTAGHESIAAQHAEAWAAILQLDEASTAIMKDILYYYGQRAQEEMKVINRDFGIVDKKSFEQASIELLRDSLQIRHLVLRDHYFEFTKELERKLLPEEFDRYAQLCEHFQIEY